VSSFIRYINSVCHSSFLLDMFYIKLIFFLFILLLTLKRKLSEINIRIKILNHFLSKKETTSLKFLMFVISFDLFYFPIPPIAPVTPPTAPPTVSSTLSTSPSTISPTVPSSDSTSSKTVSLIAYDVSIIE
jgi:hypothetical protein